MPAAATGRPARQGGLAPAIRSRVALLRSRMRDTLSRIVIYLPTERPAIARPTVRAKTDDVAKLNVAGIEELELLRCQDAVFP